MNWKYISAAIAVSVFAVLLCSFIVSNEHSDDGIPNGEDYLYVMYTDSVANINVIDVYESHYESGSATPLEQRYRTSVGIDGINGFWKFDSNGLGPFNCFYAAINLLDDCPEYAADDSGEKRLSSSVGRIAYVLDPNDLGSTISGHRYNGELYNIMLVIPTVYWSSAKIVQSESVGNLKEGETYNILFMSSRPTYSLDKDHKMTDMIPYAHSASYETGKTDFSSSVYPYLCIGVYESYVSDSDDIIGEGLLVSQSGRAVSHNKDVDEYKQYADMLTPASTKGLVSDYQLWNFYQWTLCKMMGYTVMGSKNAQVMIGQGFSDDNTSPARSGSTDDVGFYGNAKSTESESGEITTEGGRVSSKLFIENSWGSLNEFVGDTYVEGFTSDDQRLHAGNYLGGEFLIDSRDLPDTGGVWADISPGKGISAADSRAWVWDIPILTEKGSHPDDPGYPGDAMNGASSGVHSVVTGGNWDHKHNNGLAFACAGYEIDYTAQYRGARLAYLLAEA